MKLKNKSLLTSLLIYFSIFSIGITTILYIFQTVIFNEYYRYSRKHNLEHVVTKIEKTITNKKYTKELDKLAAENNICIFIIENNNEIYQTELHQRCYRARSSERYTKIKKKLINNNIKEVKKEVKTNNPNKIKAFIYAKKINNKAIIATTSLEPSDRSIQVIREQIKYIGILIFVLSFIASYVFAKRIARPIITITNEATKLGSKKEKANFKEDNKIKELDQLAKTLNNASIELEKTEELRREFIANISHDLKTPLTMIEAYAASARDLNYNNKKKREKDLDIIISEAERLNMLVNDILTISMIQSKTKQLDFVDINITHLIKTVLESFSVYRNSGYILNFKETKNYIIKADRQSIERIMYNLITNAINYSGTKKTVTVSFEEEKHYLKIKVSDTGKGLDEEDKKLVWNRYFRTNKRHRREVNGTGLGLSITRELLEVHNFEYGIDSKINKGSTFWFKCKIYNKNKKENK